MQYGACLLDLSFQGLVAKGHLSGATQRLFQVVWNSFRRNFQRTYTKCLESYFEENAERAAVDLSHVPAQLGAVSSQMHRFRGLRWCGSPCRPETGIRNSFCGRVAFRGTERTVFDGVGWLQ